MIPSVIFGRPHQFAIDFQQELLERFGCSIANNLPHLWHTERARLWWKGVRAYSGSIFILPIWGYHESEVRKEETYQS